MDDSKDKVKDSTYYVNLFIDIMFAIDIMVIFNSAYYTVDSDLIDSRATITKEYLTGWFLIDLFAIIPFDALLEAINFN